jgi:hypothetical protein
MASTRGGSMGTEPRDDYAYTGLHAYVLVHDVTATTADPGRNASGFIQQLQGMAQDQGPVTAAVELAGTFKGLVHLRFDDGDVNGVQDYLATALWNGVTHELAYEGPVYMGPTQELIGLKRHLCDIVAIVRVWVEKGRTREVLGRLGDELGDRFHGASIVYGGCDILLALEGPTFKEVASAAFTKLQQIEGIVRTETSFTDYRRVPDRQSAG